MTVNPSDKPIAAENAEITVETRWIFCTVAELGFEVLETLSVLEDGMFEYQAWSTKNAKGNQIAVLRSNKSFENHENLGSN